MPTTLINRPIDATLSVTKAARLLGVHPNTVRAWSDQGRLRFYRINPRGDRRYRLGDLQRFLAAAESRAGITGMGHLAPAIGRRGPGGQPAIRPLDRGTGGLPAPRPRRIVGATPALDPAPRAAVDRPDLEILGRLAGHGAAADPWAGLAAACRDIRDGFDYQAVGIYELRGETLALRAGAASGSTRLIDLPAGHGVLGRALADGLTIRAAGDALDWRIQLGAILGQPSTDLAAPIAGDDGPWGVLLIIGQPGRSLDEGDAAFASTAAAIVGASLRLVGAAAEVSRQLDRADALRRVAADVGSRLDIDQIVAGLVDHATVLFGADRTAVFLRGPDHRLGPVGSRGLSSRYLKAVLEPGARSLRVEAIAARRPLFATGYADDPRATQIRAAVIQEGFDTVCSVPVFDGRDLLGIVDIHHDQPHAWSPAELETADAFAGQAAAAIRTAQNYSQMATWAAHLQSIQQLGARLSRLASGREIGLAMATELRQIIDYHNVRVYRQEGDDLIPIAMLGQVGEYVDETPDQLRLAVGEGITGWVARHRIAQNLPNSAADPRAITIPGTEPDLDESMLLAPMLFEDQSLGVIVLSKLGLHQFIDDDLRLLVIFASIAAQAIANAEATERLRTQSATLERQLRSQQELLQITESILTTLDPRAIPEQIVERLGELVGYDNVAIALADPLTRRLDPLTARGVHAEQFLEPWGSGDVGVANWVVANNEPVLVVDERNDPRVNHFRGPEAIEGSLIVVPLRGRSGATGVLTLERLGPGNVYTTDEFELVKLFAAQVSIALQNAEIHRAVQIRARTDDLTTLLNHGTFQEQLRLSVDEGEPFGLVMLDLDDFKSVNDALGHQAGDRLLREIAAAIVRAGRDSDHVFRYGGDEFAMIVPRADAASAMAVAERVRSAVHAIGGPGSRWQADRIGISVSIGVATYPVDGDTAESMLLAADRACFVAKRTGNGLIGTAVEGLALAAEFTLQSPTPVDPPSELVPPVE